MLKKMYRIKELSKMLSIGESTIWKLVADESSGFPKPIKISPRLTVWMEQDILDWLSSHSDIKTGGNNNE